MIKLRNVEKYFFKGRKKQITAIDHTTLDFGEKGLVALLGPSGCGKTTLLNMIGGLDKASGGDILIDGISIGKISAGKKDAIRNKYIGYIFQNYNLIDDMTVFDNVAIVLKMQGIRDTEEIKEKVNYVLKKVGMYRYRKRYAGMLSGGERQRVGIARAIVKNPPVIIADEPTGNLDSRNTIEVMNIIKSISREKLVILVTHEEKLADFYATRIIRIKDGRVVSDLENTKERNLDYIMDNRIYLGDMKRKEAVNSETAEITVYSDDEEKASVEIAIRNGNIYIRSKNDAARIEVVDENSSMEMIDGRYTGMTKEEQEKYHFDTKILEKKSPILYTGTVSVTEVIKNGFRKVFCYSRTKKILLIGFFITAMFIFYGMSSILGIIDIEDREFVKVNRDYMSAETKNITVDQYEKLKNDENTEYVLPGNSIINLYFTNKDFYQTGNYKTSFSGSLSDIDMIVQEDIYVGKIPVSDREIILDKLVVENVIEDGSYGLKNTGISKSADMVGRKVTVPYMGEFTVAGIVDKGSPCIYTDSKFFVNLLSNGAVLDDSSSIENSKMVSYKLAQDNVQLVEGTWPENDYTVMLPIEMKGQYYIGSATDQTVNGRKLNVSGFYKGTEAAYTSIMLTDDKMIEYRNVENLPVLQNAVTIYTSSKEKTATIASEIGIDLKESYTIDRDKYIEGKKNQILSTIILGVIILLISVIEIFLIIRASFLSRIKEIGVYRAIGMKKSDIYLSFAGEIIAITTMASLPGIVCMGYILHKLTSVSLIASDFMFNIPVTIAAVIVVYGINLLFGLFPVAKVLRKTPAEILARIDV